MSVSTQAQRREQSRVALLESAARHLSRYGYGNLKLEDVAAYLSTSVPQVYALVRSGELPAIKLGGRGVWRVDRDKLDAYLEELSRRLPRGAHGLDPGVVAASQRTRLLEAVGRAVAERGYAAATIDDIVRGAGVSKKTFYEHFRDKEGCFVAAYEAARDELYARVHDAHLQRPEAGIEVDRLALGLGRQDAGQTPDLRPDHRFPEREGLHDERREQRLEVAGTRDDPEDAEALQHL